MPRLVFTDSPEQMVQKIAGRHIGATSCLFAVAKSIEGHRELGWDYIGMLLVLDELELYEEDLYLLWNDLCHRSIATFSMVISRVKMAPALGDYVKHAVSRCRAGERSKLAANFARHLMLPAPGVEDG